MATKHGKAYSRYKSLKKQYINNVLYTQCIVRISGMTSCPPLVQVPSSVGGSLPREEGAGQSAPWRERAGPGTSTRSPCTTREGASQPNKCLQDSSVTIQKIFIFIIICNKQRVLLQIWILNHR